MPSILACQQQHASSALAMGGVADYAAGLWLAVFSSSRRRIMFDKTLAHTPRSSSRAPSRLKAYHPPHRTLHSAAEHGDIESIMFHLLEGADINARKSRGYFPLGAATHFGHATAVQFLIDHGADIEMLTEYRWSPLYIAAWQQHLDVAKVLLTAGASTKPRSGYGEYSPSPSDFTALHAAAHLGNTKMVRLLLKYGASPSEKTHGELPEEIAANNGHKQIARILRAHRRAGRGPMIRP